MSTEKTHKNKVVLVTGGSRGIGRAIALRMAGEGAQLVINYNRSRKKAEELAEHIEAEGGLKPLVIRANVSKTEDLDELVKEVDQAYGKLNVLISNAATGVLKPTPELTLKHWSWTMETNATALLPLVQKCLPLFEKTEGTKRILALSSIGSIRVIPNYAAVGTSKAALESLVRYYAVDLAPKGITANTISAGVVDTDALKHFPNREDLLESGEGRTPLGRIVTPDDVSGVVSLMCRPETEMITGQTIFVDGGISILS